METPNTIVIHAAGHPAFAVQRAGFPLDHPYVEQCWTSMLGPSGVLFLRRMPELWRQGTTVGVEVEALARSLGLGAAKGRRSAMWRTMDRLCNMRFAQWGGEQELEVYTEVRPLTARQLERVPELVRDTHERLLGEHLDRLATPLATPQPPVAGVTDLTRRLDRLQQRSLTHELTR
jgi:hypothetical protein